MGGVFLENKSGDGLVITGFVLSIFGLLMGLIPFLGWILLILATIFVAISFKKSNNKGLSVSSLVMVIITWIYKIIVLVVLILAIVSYDSGEIEKEVEGQTQYKYEVVE